MTKNTEVEIVEAATVVNAKAVNKELAAEIPEPTTEQINQWKAQYGEVYKISSDNDDLELTLYFRKPLRQHLSRFTKSVMGDSLKAMHNLVQDTLIYPDMAAIAPLLTEKPGLIVPIGTQLQEIVGTNNSFLAKKL